MKIPSTKDEWVSLGAKLLWAFSRLQILGLVLGAVGALAVQFLTGFWDFRNEHQELIRKQYDAAVVAHRQFEGQMLKYAAVFEGRSVPEADGKYATEAQNYIHTLEDVTRLLPSTREDLNRYIATLSNLNAYYGAPNPPSKGTEEWMKFYGNFRLDYDKYAQAKELYLQALASELGDYGRYLRNS